VSRFAGSLQAFGSVFANPRVRNVQLAGVGSTLGTWAYGVALPVYAYHAGGARELVATNLTAIPGDVRVEEADRLVAATEAAVKSL